MTDRVDRGEAAAPAWWSGSADRIAGLLSSVGYLAGEHACAVLRLAGQLGKPVLVEGPAGTGKTGLATSLAAAAGSRLIRLQCHEGLDEARALYEWNHSRQLLRIMAGRAGGWPEAAVFTEEFLLARPLLEAIRATEPVVLLIDEADRLGMEAEALLLEVLSDYQVSIPEFGTVTGRQVPTVVLTSNGSRDLTEALRRRCLYLHLDYPRSSGSGRSWPYGSLGFPSTWPGRSPRSSARCAGLTCASARRWRRPWSGPGRCSPSARRTWTPGWPPSRCRLCSVSGRTWSWPPRSWPRAGWPAADRLSSPGSPARPACTGRQTGCRNDPRRAA
jgi:hypothetical protein